ncbi:MAG TPA: adenosylcobinamide-GDP ribazoletransferase [Methylophilaceae bacterium]|nr:adenosylcobinamide-GDP ribazoletransferase [Methylophilaceae bacterium]
MLVKEWRYFLLAVGFFTRIPVPQQVDFDERELNYASKYFPLIGIFVGFIGACVYLISVAFLPLAIAILLSMASTIYLTGAFHEDGLSDSADGMGGGWSREKILTIMKDSRLGTYGAITLCLFLFSKFHLLYALNNEWIPIAMLMAHAISRLCAVWVMATLNYAKQSGKAKPLATEIKGDALLIANVLGLLPLLIVMVLLVINHHSVVKIAMLILMTGLPVMLSWFWWQRKVKRWLGGYTGDTLGAMQQITELAFYFGLVLWSVHH